jgi:acyl dehydratase
MAQPQQQPPGALLSFLSLLMGPLVLLWGLLRRWRQPSPPSVPRMPSLAELYGRVATGALKPKLPKSLEGHPKIAVAVEEPVVIDPARLATYLNLVKFPALEAAAAGAVDAPAAFLFAEAFRVGMLAMAQPAFPFNVLGAVLSRSTLRLEKPVRVGDRLLFSAEIDPSTYRRNAKGDVEAVVRTLARDASSNETVWTSDLTVLVLDPKRSRGAGGGADKKRALEAAAKGAGEDPYLVLAPELRIGGDAGRRYGALSGDRNPIHLHALTAQLFGFKKPIAHAMYLVGCMEAALRGYKGDQEAAAGGNKKATRGAAAAASGPFASARYPLTLESEFKRPTAIPAKLRAVLPSAPQGGDEVVQVAVVEPRGAVVKDVIVGVLRQGAKAAGAAK